MSFSALHLELPTEHVSPLRILPESVEEVDQNLTGNFFDSIKRFQSATIEDLQSLIPINSDGFRIVEWVSSREELLRLWNASGEY